MNSPAIHDGRKVGGNLNLGKWKERWELEQEGLHVCFSPTLKPRSRGEKAPGRKAGMTENKGGDHSNSVAEMGHSPQT